MTYEQIIEELKKLKAHNNTLPSEEQAEVDANINKEVEEIDATIEEYNEKIEALEAKLADESNYQYNNDNEERDLTIELLEESFENQLEVIAREDEEYKSLQELATNVFTDYNLEIATLNNEIEVIERRLRKNDIAVRKNIGIRLTEDELFNLNLDLEYKKARIKECEEMKAKYVEDLSNYGELITANNRKREVVLSKQESLNKIKEHRDSKTGTIDNAKLRVDKDELASLKAGVAALNSRKEYITYNPNAEIDKLIGAIEQNKIQENNDVTAVKDDLENLANQAEVETQDEIKNQIEPENQVEEPTEDKAQTLINAYLDGEEIEEPKKDERIFTDEERVLFGPNKGILGIPEETTAHDIWLAGNPDLDTEREAEIEEANEILTEKKREGWFKRNWKKWTAAALATLALIAVLKGCDANTNKVEKDQPDNNDASYSQTDDGVTAENDAIYNNLIDDTGDTSSNSDDEKIEQDQEIDSNQTVEENQELENEPVPEVDDNLGDDTLGDDTLSDETAPEPEPEPTVETGKIELEQGESVISADDLFSGNINEDTVIEHGDEVGKTTDNAELTDYTQEGSAVVEYDSETTPSTTDEQTNTSEDIIKYLEEYMNGDITLTEEGQKLVDEMSGKTR